VDGDPVTGELSQDLIPKTLTEVFLRVFPQYLAMGMSYDEFWRGPASLVKAYREAEELRRQQEEWARWRQGAYFYDALLRVAPVMRASFGGGKVEPGRYPDEPWPLTEKEARERAEAREKENYERYIAQMELASARELKRRAEAEEAARKEVSEHG
jgi:hypothetical protein